MSLDPRHLVQLSAIAAAGSFAEAAQHLDMAQSALSRNIKTLEERVGAPVLRRGRRGAEPTELGATLAKLGDVIRSAHREASSIVSSISSPRADRLRIGATQIIADNFLIKPLVEFMRRRMEVSCFVQTGSIEELIEFVSLGEVDLAIGQFGAITNLQELHLDLLVQDHLTVVARRNHPLQRSNEPAADVLSQASWVLPRSHSRLRWQIENALRTLGVSCIDATYETTSMAVMMAIVRQSDCIAMVPRFAVSPLLEERQIVELLPEHTVMHRPIGILCQVGKRKSAIVNSFYRDLHRFARRAMAGALA